MATTTNLSKIIKISRANYNTLIANGQVTIGGVTYTFDANAIYITDDFLENVYPVGAIYMSTSSTSPGELFGGSGVRIEGRFLLGASSTYTAGGTSGSAHAVLISHAHSIVGSTAYAGDHSHSVAGTTGTGGQGTVYTRNYNGGDPLVVSASNTWHTKNGGPTKIYDPANGSSNKSYSIVGHNGHTHSVNLSAAASGSHRHTVNGYVSGTTAGSTVTITGPNERNMPPYLAVYIWRRTA